MRDVQKIAAAFTLLAASAASNAAVDLGNDEWLVNFNSYGGGLVLNPFTGPFAEGVLGFRPVDQNGETVTATDQPTNFFTSDYPTYNVSGLIGPAMLPNFAAGVRGEGFAESPTQNPFGTGIFQLLSITFIASGPKLNAFGEENEQPIKVSYVLEDGTSVSEILMIGTLLDSNLYDQNNVINKYAGLHITDFKYTSLGDQPVSIDDIKVRVNIAPNVSAVPLSSTAWFLGAPLAWLGWKRRTTDLNNNNGPA